MRKFMLIAGLALCLSLAFAVHAQDNPTTTRDAAPDASGAQLVPVANGLTRPIFLTNAGDGSGRLFVAEQTGAIRVIENGTVRPTPFLDISALLSRDVFAQGYSERGLLGMAFHPDYANNGQFFIHYTDTEGNTTIARYHVSTDPNVANPNSAEIILTHEQPYANHNGGMIAFGPDGYLYIGLGDGGSAGDPNQNGQNKSVLLAKILRIDVDSGTPYAIPPDNPVTTDPDFAPEVWAYGLRNPWRFSFDAATGDMYIGDVGQSSWEEIDFEPAGSPGGSNYGWSEFEANHTFRSTTPPPNMVAPVAEYGHSSGISVTGGYVYRGALVPDLQGVYFYADWGYGTIWALWRDASGAWNNEVFFPPAGFTVSSFGEDEQHELYVVDYSGTILRFAPQ
jgi:glucose/arabinose dehydrogenase